MSCIGSKTELKYKMISIGLKEPFKWVTRYGSSGNSVGKTQCIQGGIRSYYSSLWLFQVTALIGPVAYKLKLPIEAKIHDVFHVSQLKLFYGPLPQTLHNPHWVQETATHFKILEAIIE